MTVSVTESMSFFDPRNPIRDRTLLQTQYDPSTPLVDTLRRGTNLLVPDFRLPTRLEHFPSDLYDLRPHSHLVRFMAAMLGDSGVGQMRKRYLMARLQQALTSTHFYDLDRFYGALFGAQRLRVERLPFDPMLYIATGDEWDAVYSADASYRERIIALAKAIPLGATVPGMKVAAEAVTSVECEVTETWRSLDYARRYGYRTKDDIVPREWREVEAYLGTYGAGAGQTWGTVAGVPLTFIDHNRTMNEVQADFPHYSDADSKAVPPIDYFTVQYRRTKIGRVRNDRTEFTVRPKKHYPLTSSRSKSERAQDEYALRRVLNTLKPAASRLTLDMEGVALYDAVTLGNITSDSNYWEVCTRVTPRTSISLPENTYPLTAGQQADRVAEGEERVVGRPPFSQTQGTSWSYNNEVVSVRSYTQDASGNRVDSSDYETTVNFVGEVQAYTPDRGVLDPRRAEAARLAQDGMTVAHPYSSSRKVVATHD